MIKLIVKGVWQFCSYLFVPQWGRNRNNNVSTYKILICESWDLLVMSNSNSDVARYRF